MNTSTKHNNLTAVVSFEGSLGKLYSCLQALDTWIMQIIVVLPKNKEIERKIASKFNVLLCYQKSSTTKGKWESGLNEANTPWVLLIRSNEIVTGQLRQAITEKTKTSVGETHKYLLPLTIVFLKKRLKYPLDWSNSQASLLVHNSKVINDVNQQGEHETLDGELVRYDEDTIAECASLVIQKAEERAASLAQHQKHFSATSFFLRAFISSIEAFIRIYILKKGFKEGFEGITFAVCDAHAELLGYLRYHELYVRGGKLLHNKLPSIKKILIIKLRDIGDNVFCTPLIKNLKQQLPNTSLSVLTWSYSKPVFEKNPNISYLFDLPKEPSSKDIKKLCIKLNSINFDVIISTHSGRLPSKLLLDINSQHKINNHYRGRNKHYTVLTEESDYYRSAIERDLDCMRSLGLKPNNTETEIFLTPAETNWAQAELQKHGLNLKIPTILIHPTAGVAIKEWPIDKFGKLLQMLNQKKNIQLLVLCTKAELSRVQPLLRHLPNLVILNELTLRQAMSIIKECALVIDNDSSPSHIAVSFGVPAIVLFSQSIRKIFCPYLENSKYYVFYNDVNCRECELITCDDRICLYFSPSDVYDQALKMLFPKIN
jgi:ADP-heptose:LPS heptosyltransferase